MADLTEKINRIANNVSDTYAVLNAMGATMPANANSDNLPATAASIKVVKKMEYNEAANNWTVTYTDNTTETVAGPALFSGKYSDLSGVPSTFTPAAHNQAASTITAGTFAGKVLANSSGQTPGEYVMRNSKFAASDENPTVSGQVCWVRK